MWVNEGYVPKVAAQWRGGGELTLDSNQSTNLTM